MSFRALSQLDWRRSCNCLPEAPTNWQRWTTSSRGERSSAWSDQPWARCRRRCQLEWWRNPASTDRQTDSESIKTELTDGPWCWWQTWNKNSSERRHLRGFKRAPGSWRRCVSPRGCSKAEAFLEANWSFPLLPWWWSFRLQVMYWERYGVRKCLWCTMGTFDWLQWWDSDMQGNRLARKVKSHQVS